MRNNRPFAPPPVETAFSTTPTMTAFSSTPTLRFLEPYDESAYRLAHQPRSEVSTCRACRVGLFITLFCYGVLLLLLLFLGMRLAYACGDLPPPDPIALQLKVAPAMEVEDEEEALAAPGVDGGGAARGGARLSCAIR